MLVDVVFLSVAPSKLTMNLVHQQCTEIYVCFLQGDHLSGKAGNVRELYRCQGNVRNFTKSHGNDRELSEKNSCHGKLPKKPT